MKKLRFLVYHKEYEAFLKDIRKLGVIHVSEKQRGTPEDESVQEKMRLASRLHTLINQFKAINVKHKLQPVLHASVERGLTVLNEVHELHLEELSLTAQLQGLQKDEEALMRWGDFDPDNLSLLRDAGYKVRFFACAEKKFDEKWIEMYNAVVISTHTSKIYFITITKLGEKTPIEAETIKLPCTSLSQVRGHIASVNSHLKANTVKLTEFAANDLQSVKLAERSVRAEIEFSKVLLNTDHTVEEKVMLLQGWIPASKEKEVTGHLDGYQAYYEISDPTPGDDVPILLKNRGLFAWFEPICRLYMLPKYGELDLTPFFAPFFMIFFGLCLGDIGYGLFLFLGALAYRLWAKHITPGQRPVLSLIKVLSISTMLCGLLTGGFFGFSLYELDWPVAQKLRDIVSLNNNQMFHLSLIFGVVQILFGMILKAVNKAIQFGLKYALSTLGWIIIFLSVLFATVFPAILPMTGVVHLGIMGLSALLIFLFNSPGKNIFLNIGLGFWDSYNMLTGLLGDVLSYVRLFALGLSGGILASVFNSLAQGLSPDHIIAGPIVMALIFVIGHAINIFMNVLGAMVHPMRLTFVEFFKNAGYTGGGTEFKPFSK